MATRRNTKIYGLSIVGTVIAAIAFACSSSPTGRKQLTLMPDGQMNSMGAQAFDAMKKETPVETDAATNAYVKCIAVPLTQLAADDTGVKDWEIVVFREKSANAFALPGGKIGVHTGILSVAKTPSQLAAVLGHEVGHVIARHGNERVSQGLIAQGLSTVAAVSLKDKKYQPLVLAGLGVGAQFGIILPHSRGGEKEADMIGLDLMAQAGFDPRESTQLWRNMGAAAGGSAPPEFMSTHPSNETRIQGLEAGIPAALPKYQAVLNAGRAPKCVPPAK